MFRYRLRTLLIVLALGPPLIWAAWAFWPPKPKHATFTRDEYRVILQEWDRQWNAAPGEVWAKEPLGEIR
jgi:hypothetical protein